MSEHRWRLIVIFISRIEPPHPHPRPLRCSGVTIQCISVATGAGGDFIITRKAPNRVS